jgi:hypothetical protein
VTGSTWASSGCAVPGFYLDSNGTVVTFSF